MEEDYEKCKKYDDPNYGGEPLELKGKFEKAKFEDGTQFKDHEEVDRKVEDNAKESGKAKEVGKDCADKDEKLGE